MSNICTAIAQRRVVGSGTKKAVLMYLADRASDDGSGIWTSKSHIAADTEFSKRSVQNAINDFEAAGIIKKTGTKKCQNGFTYEYCINISALKSLPSTRKLTGAGDSPVQEIHLTGAGDSPHGVQEIHPNHPLTILEPSNTRERADDLFSENEQQAKPDSTDAFIEEGFKQFWEEIWPSHQRKTQKADCRKVYTQACSGKHPKADQITPQALNAATRRYIATVTDRQFLKGPLPWLRAPGWEAFVTEAGAKMDWSTLSHSARRMLEDGKCPPSMLDANGQPSALAMAYLAEVAR